MAWLMFLFCLLFVKNCTPQGWWLSPEDGTTCKNGTCGETDTTCECSLTIEHRLTMMTTDPPLLVVPKNGSLILYNSSKLPDEKMSEVITCDGNGSRLVIAINGKFPGPTIEAYEDQTMIIHVRNLMHTDSTTIHWHGMHQKGTPGSDGVAFISQSPILPGHTYTYKFTAQPHGTSFYHAHIGDQRSMGLYGGLIIYPKYKFYSQPQVGFTVIIQDWNHDDEPETLYQRMINGVYNQNTKKYIEPTQSIDGANFSRFHMHSGLINGKGRFYSSDENHNEAPLEMFEVQSGQTYRFRVISAATLYPFRVYIQNHSELNIRASDGFEIAFDTENNGNNRSDLIVESFIIHPGERYDFTFNANQSNGSYLLVAESIEDLSNKNPPEYHAAEAIIYYKGTTPDYQSTKFNIAQHVCPYETCVTFNCPYLYYPSDNKRSCLTLDKANSNESLSKFKEIQNVDETLFFNFAFPGEPRNTPGSVNGHQFIFPTSPILTNEQDLTTHCRNSDCGEDKICSCTYNVELTSDRVYQFVLTNLGNGRGWSHPVHLHGHYFYVMKMGFGSYDTVLGKFLTSTTDIECIGSKNYCNSARWANNTWNNAANSIPGLKLKNPLQKDTIIVPTGGYVIIRFKANNPGAWFFHCHIDLHNTNGMGMVLLESKDKYPNKGDSIRKGSYHILVLFTFLGLAFLLV